MAAAAAAAAAAAVVVAVVRGGKLAFGAHTYYAQHLGQALGVARVYRACRPRAALGQNACVGRV